MIILMFDQRQSVTKYLGNDESGGIGATNAVLFVVLQSAILQLPPFNYMALSIRSSNPSAVSSHIIDTRGGRLKEYGRQKQCFGSA